MKSAGDILELACRRIADLDTPAYVKNSELRYIAVNEAYADFFGREISDFIGRRSRELFDRPEEEDREDRERRALVFGTEETPSASMPQASTTSASRSKASLRRRIGPMCSAFSKCASAAPLPLVSATSRL
ncbi:two-component sensor histidine kinase/response regulator hybrid protein [Rhizobium sp. Pop5]|nr:two-component sensor histidine kinase/response regulator hybrid protein [Rhizobium sp. Pop5]